MVEESEMITSGLACKDHVPFGRFAYDVHPSNKAQENGTKSLSEGVGNISIYDSRSQISENWIQRVVSSGNVEELYSREKTAVLSSTCGSTNGASQIIKSYTVQSTIQQVFWCSFLLPSNQVDVDTGAIADDEVQTGFCVVESNCVTIVTDGGQEHHVTLPFHIVNAWPLEKGILFQRALEKSADGCNNSATLPIWFSMLHPLADLSPVICRSGSELSFVSASNQHIAFVSNEASPYLAVIYDADTKCHSMYLIRRTLPEEEKTYTELNATQAPDHSWQPRHLTTAVNQTAGLTPGGTTISGFLTLSSVLSPAATPPRIGGTLGTPSLRGHNLTNSPHLNKLNPTLSLNSPSLSSMHYMSSLQRHATASPSISTSVAHSSFTSTGNHHQLLTQGMNMPAEMLEPIRPDICLLHVWTDHSFSVKGKACKVFITTDHCGQSYLCLLLAASVCLRCIKISIGHSPTESVIFGNAVNINAQDACHAPSLNMLVVLDIQSSIHLYSGPTQISLLYIPRLSFGGLAPSLSTTPVRPTRNTIRASSRPGSAKGSSKATTPGLPQMMLDTSQEELNWSPVQVELNDSTNLLVQGADDLPDKTIESLHSITKRRLTLRLSNGQMCSTELPPLWTDSGVAVCLQAFSAHLPHSVAMSVLPRWYLLNQVSADAITKETELDRFLKYILELCGLPADPTLDSSSQPSSPSQTKKRAKTISQANDSDFDQLLSHPRCQRYRQDSSLLGIVIPSQSVTDCILPTENLILDEELQPEKSLVKESKAKRSVHMSYTQRVDSQSPLAQNIHVVFLIIHLCYEEMKLNNSFSKMTPHLAKVLLQLSLCLKLKEYTIIYLKDFPQLSATDLSHWKSISISGKVVPPHWFPVEARSMPQLLADILLSGRSCYTVYYLPGTTHRIESLVKLYSMYSSKSTHYAQVNTDFLQPLPVTGHASANKSAEDMAAVLANCSTVEEMMLLYMCAQGMDQLTIDSIPFACTLLLYEAIYRCQSDAKTSWPRAALALVKRQDLAALSNPSLLPTSSNSTVNSNIDEEATRLFLHQSFATTNKLKQLNGMEVLDQRVLKMRWSNDLRLEEVKRCLNSSQPVKITIQQKPEVSDHQFIEQKQRHLHALCQRTMALPVARGMLTLRSHKPVLTESVHIPVLSMSGKSYPTQSSVELSGDSQGSTATRLTVWPAFHNGVAAGLCLDKEAEVDTAWILYNKPKVTDKDEMNLISEHAGFLLALGMNGYLNNLARLSLHDYLSKGHEMTAVGILLGISASMRGTMDIATVRLLTIHTPSLLPPSSTRLDIAHSTKIAALIGLGLVYYGSTHRHIAGVLLHEIDHSPDIVSKGVTDDRESYSLAAGLALGMVMMGKGTDMIGLHDLHIANRLSMLMTGGHRSADMCKGVHGTTGRLTSEQVYEGELINIDVTGAGATIALGLTHFNTKSKTVCDWLKLPHSQYLLESIRPDHLQLRTLADALVRWDNILPTEGWVESYLPPIVAENSFKTLSNESYDAVDYETHSQAYCYIIGGACFAVGLKFAGSSNKSAYDLLLHFTRKFVNIYQKPALVEQSGRHVLENALCTCLLSLAMVMSGSGDLEVFRLCRYLRSRIAVPMVTYGSHMVIHMALALLFLGSGRYTLSSKPETLPLLICAFFPRFPVHSNDNRYHLQALRHLYVQAVEPRLLFPVDIDTGEPCYVPIEVTLRATDYYDRYTYVTYAPSILPDLDIIEKVEICDRRYWPMEFTSENNLKCIRKLLNRREGLAVKRRSGHFPYAVDPQGVLGAMSRAMMFNTDEVNSSEPLEKLQRFFLTKEQIDERSFLYLTAREAVSKDKTELLSVYHKLYQIVSKDNCPGTDLQQLYLLVMYMRLSRDCVISLDLAELALQIIRKANSTRLSTTQVFGRLNMTAGRLNELLEYCTEGRYPTNEDILKHLALYSDIIHSCVKSVGDWNMPVLLAKLHLSLEVSTQLLAFFRHRLEDIS